MAKRYVASNAPRKDWYRKGSYTGPELPRVPMPGDRDAISEHLEAWSAFGGDLPTGRAKVRMRRKRGKGALR